MNNQNYLIDALETILTGDIADDLIPLAVNNHVRLLAGFDAEDLWVDVHD